MLTVGPAAVFTCTAFHHIVVALLQNFLTVRQVPLTATLAPIWTLSTFPAGNCILILLKLSRSSTCTTEAWPCTMPVADRCISNQMHWS